MFRKNPFKGRLRINNQIRIAKVRLIDEKGAQVGIVDTSKALGLSREAGLDLVEIVPNAKPPVVKIMDWGKYQYNKKKQEKKSRIKSKKGEIKGIRLGIKTDSHDLKVKKNRALKFLEKDFKVSVEVMLRGREKMFFNKAREALESFIKGLEVPIEFDQPIKKTPNGFNAVIKNP